MNDSKKNFDDSQREAIYADENAVVSAGAGSGKTSVLVERYARLVEKKNLPVDSILALTFTRKAAAEMNSRIHARLSASADPAAQEQIKLFDTARISTLDSFCGMIARGAAHRYGIPPDFTVDETRLAQAADEIAVELLMDRKDDPVLRRLVATLGFDRVRRALFAEIAARHMSAAKKPAFAQDARRQVQELKRSLAQARTELEDACRSILAIEDDGGDSLQKAKSLIESLLPLTEGDSDADLSELARRAGVLLSGELRRPGVAKKPGLVLLKDLIEPVKEWADKAALLAESCRLKDDIEAIGALLDELARRFLERKRREGVLSFQDCAELATDILKNDRDIRGYYKRHLKSILIDEFQDNNELQKELLFLLAEREDRHASGIPSPEDLFPDKLFFVGDEKQSIYRFRGADVSVFRRLSNELDKTTGKKTDIALKYNYRSSAELVAFFNAVFPGVFGAAEQDFEARFSSVDTNKKTDAPPTDAPAVEFHILEPAETGDDDDAVELSAAAAEAEAAAARIRQGIDSGEFSYADVAVLFRSTSRQDAYERAFRAAGIPCQAADPRGLFAEGPANDLYAALRLCLFPKDRNAYAALLRSPFVRLGDESLARVMLDSGREPFPADAEELGWFSSAEDAARFRRGAELYASLRENVDRVGISALSARLWYDEGYRAGLIAERRSPGEADHFEKLYTLALDADKRRLPLAAFLDELTPLMGSAEKVEGDEASDAAGDAVLLMTVHKSKGLEFPVVIVADSGNDGRGIRNDQPFYVDSNFGVVVNLRREDASRKNKIGNWFFAREKDAEEERSLAELRRLLYVAATRAEKKLLFFGNKKTNDAYREKLAGLEGQERLTEFLKTRRIKADGGQTAPKSFFDLIAEGLSAPAGADARYSVHSIDTKPKRRRAAAEKSRALPDGFYASARLEPRRELGRTISPTAIEACRLSRGPKRAGAKKEAAPLDIDTFLSDRKIESEFGTLCHLAIERAFLSADAGGPAAVQPPIEDCAAILPDLSDAERAEAASAAARLARVFFDSDLGRTALGSKRRRSEFPFLLALEQKGTRRPYVVNGKMDLIFEIPGNPGRCVIVDFKTDREIDADAHIAQMACYRKAALAFSDLEPRSFLFYLRGGVVVPIDDDVDLSQWASIALNPASSGDDR